ncbi:MAG: phosphatidylglycerophosphatase A [Deltaproteobacteria bacterium]|nr:phosphatidylglycerophosphatase A [Deltaproteobacteria bacterium]
MNFREKMSVFLATGFYVGNIPFAPGTFGSLLGLPLCFILAGIQLPPAIIVVVLFIGLAVWVSNNAARTLKRKDPGCIVIDEIAGMMVTLIGVPVHLTSVIIGFILFRILDIAKPFPIRMIDKRLSGGLGIVADDVVAGIFANMLTRISLIFLGIY